MSQINYRRSLTKRLGIVVLILIIPTAIARGSNWPSWRGDGTGVSDEIGLPQSWSATENVVWCTPIPGQGFSSPVVWNDRIFVTSATAGSTKATTHLVSVVLIWAFAFAALWWQAGERFPTGGDWGPVPVGATRRLFLSSLFVVVILGPILALKLLRDVSFEALPSLTDLAILGVLGAFVKQAAEVFLDRRRSSAPSSPVLHRTVGWLQHLSVTAIIGIFLAIVLVYTITEEYLRLPRLIWPPSLTISCLGLIAAFGTVHRASRWRLAAPGIAVAFLVLALANVPEPGNWRAMISKPTISLAALVTILASVWFAGQTFWWRRRNDGHGAGRFFQPGTAALFLLVLVYFSTNCVLLQRTDVRLNALSIDKDSGEILWTKAVAHRDLTQMASANSAATPTPVTDGRHVYVHFGNAGTYALDFGGDVIWEFHEPAPPMQYGSSSSPVLWQDLLLLTHDTDSKSFTVALDKETAEVRWRIEREPVGSRRQDCYGTPIVTSLGGKPQLVSYSTQYLAGYDLKTGRELWSFANAGVQQVASSVIWNDIIVASGGASDRPRFMGGIRLTSENGTLTPELVWEVDRNRTGTSSPVVYGNLLYSVTETGIATCRDPRSGELMWRTRLPRGAYHASLVAADGKVYFTNDTGDTSVVAAGPELNVLSTNRIEGTVRASLAISEGSIFLRTETGLYRIDEGG